MHGDYVVPLKMSQEPDSDEFDFMMVLNAEREIIWVNEKASQFFLLDLCVENHLDPSSIPEWYDYLNKVKHATIKKSYVSLLNKKKETVHFIAYGMFVHWNETYVINFRPINNHLSLFDIYDKTFKMLDEIRIGVYVSYVNGFIFSANETAKDIVPNACQMSIEALFQKFFNNERFDHYIKLLNSRNSFSTDVICQVTFESYHFMYRFDSDFDLHVVMIQNKLLKKIVENRTNPIGYLDKETAASIVHEIRNPITTLQGFVELLKRDEIKGTQYLELIESEIQRMDQLLGGMLHFLKPKVECARIELNDFLQRFLSIVEVDVQWQPVSLTFNQSPEPLYVWANEISLMQIFINITKNSLQAMQENGHITILFEKKVNNEVVICIKDTGKGMAEPQLANLFTPYYTTKHGGTGLGLSIVKKLLEDMGGRIEINSMPTVGTNVYIYLRSAEANRNLVHFDKPF